MRMLDLFSGIGGFALAAQAVWENKLNIVGFYEIDKNCQKVLQEHLPLFPIKGDIKNYDGCTAELITGGDPCPIRSKARNIKKTKHPDLSGYFLSVCGRSRARWILRENVPAPDDVHFTAALASLG